MFLFTKANPPNKKSMKICPRNPKKDPLFRRPRMPFSVEESTKSVIYIIELFIANKILLLPPSLLNLDWNKKDETRLGAE